MISRFLNEMKTICRFSLVFILCTLISCKDKTTSQIANKAFNLDLTDAKDNLTAFMKTRANLDEKKETVFWWTGKVYSFEPQKRSRLLFDFEGFNIARLKQTDSTYQLLTREASFYKDVKSGEILEEWSNPMTEEQVEVVHVWNDPVNIQMTKGNSVTYTELGNDHICFNADILLAYPSKLTRKEFPKNSKSDIYQSAELFQFFVDKADLNDAEQSSVYSEMSWVRVGDWLPWMEMADKEGYLVYHCRAFKLENGYQDLPKHIKDYVAANQPKYKTAPTIFTKPNETSWSYFKKLKMKN